MDSIGTPGRRGARSAFLMLLCIVLAGVLALGFARTFFLQPVFQARPLTVPLVIHGLCGTGWFALLVWQAVQVRTGNMAGHRTIGGKLGIVLATLAVLSAMWIVSLTAFDGKQTGSGLSDQSGLFIQIGTSSWFAILVLLGFRSTRRPDYHKRYMIMASIAMLAPAYSRIARLLVEGRTPVDSAFLAVPLVAALFVHDFRTLGRPHPVTLWTGLGYLAYVAVRLPIAQSDLWTKTIVPALFGI
ncbi:hypothetical protein [Novosphingobium sp.]|uniref:hypothetical protein n=1 Tax=Novosphingobium sp. TaxID=1874826 RepID=UPI0025FBFCE2|nr:hypothetical protein [Novosphingobium sp.]MCC6926605.1 hypothetical protein [Novosphingobium sp.]